MGGIDEASLDRLSLVTQMTKHIRVRASGGKTSASELGQFSAVLELLLMLQQVHWLVHQMFLVSIFHPKILISCNSHKHDIVSD